MQESITRTSENKSPARRVGTTFSEEELTRIDDWGFSRRIRDRAVVIRELVKKALEAERDERA